MREKTSEMETKTPVIWGESDSNKFSANIYSYLFFLIFQGAQKSGEQVNKVAEDFSMGGSVGAKQNSLDPLGNGVLAKRRLRFGGQRY